MAKIDRKQTKMYSFCSDVDDMNELRKMVNAFMKDGVRVSLGELIRRYIHEGIERSKESLKKKKAANKQVRSKS